MKEQLTQYINLLFAGTKNCDDIRQEILQNTLDRYSDLVAQGKSPETAYRMAISGIGDVGELLKDWEQAPSPSRPVPPPERPVQPREQPVSPPDRPLPPPTGPATPQEPKPHSPGPKTIAQSYAAGSKKPALSRSWKQPGVWLAGILVYLLISFATGAWGISWVILLMIPTTLGLIHAILDLKEAIEHEN